MENVSSKLVELRKLMAEHKIDAYVISHDDAHMVSSQFIFRVNTQLKLMNDLSSFVDFRGAQELL